MFFLLLPPEYDTSQDDALVGLNSEDGGEGTKVPTYRKVANKCQAFNK